MGRHVPFDGSSVTSQIADDSTVSHQEGLDDRDVGFLDLAFDDQLPEGIQPAQATAKRVRPRHICSHRRGAKRRTSGRSDEQRILGISEQSVAGKRLLGRIGLTPRARCFSGDVLAELGRIGQIGLGNNTHLFPHLRHSQRNDTTISHRY